MCCLKSLAIKIRNDMYDKGQMKLPLAIRKTFYYRWDRKVGYYILRSKDGKR